MPIYRMRLDHKGCRIFPEIPLEFLFAFTELCHSRNHKPQTIHASFIPTLYGSVCIYVFCGTRTNLIIKNIQLQTFNFIHAGWNVTLEKTFRLDWFISPSARTSVKQYYCFCLKDTRILSPNKLNIIQFIQLQNFTWRHLVSLRFYTNTTHNLRPSV